MAAYLTNALVYHPLRHAHMLEAFADIEVSLIPCESQPYSQVIFVDSKGHSQTFEMEQEVYEHRATQA